MATSESATAPAADHRHPRSVGTFLRSQMRNIAPFLTLIFLSGFFAIASPSFATLDNFGNILTQVSVTGIIAVGLTFVILCAEIDLSVASIANVTGIAVAYFTLQESYVNIANVPLPGWAAILLALALCGRTAEPGCDRGIRREIVAQVRLAQNAVFAALRRIQRSLV